MRRLVLLLLLLPVIALLLPACEGTQDDDDVTEALDCSPWWGQAPASGRLHVTEGGAGTTGTIDDPFGDLEDAIDQSRLTGERQIALTEGTFPGSHDLGAEGGDDSGLEIVGCGWENTTIEGIEDDEEDEELTSAFSITGGVNPISGITIRELTIDGARRAIVVSGATAQDEPVVLQSLRVVDSHRVAILIDGNNTRVAMTDVTVDGVTPEEGEFGWGIVIQTQANQDTDIPGPTTLDDVHVVGAHGVGLLVTGGWVEVTGSSVAETERVDGELGRGVQIQEWTRAVLTDLETSDNHDAGLYIRKPGRYADDNVTVEPVEIVGGSFTSTLAADLANGDTTGDGVVITDGGEGFDPLTLQVVAEDFEVADAARRDVLVETAHLIIVSMNGPYSLIAATQYGGIVDDGAGNPPPGTVDDLSGAELEIGRFALEPEVLAR